MPDRDAEIAELVERLGAGDEDTRIAAGERLLGIGAPAAAKLLPVLAGGGREARKAASFLLGRLGAPSARATAALGTALGDEDPKVRKNAAVALGRAGEAGTRALLAALRTEPVEWVRRSIILALGRGGGPGAEAALGDWPAASPAEAEALRKARDRLRAAPPEAAWKPGVPLPVPLCAAVPVGLEDVAAEEARQQGHATNASGEPGVLRFAPATDPRSLLSELRCAHDLRLRLARGSTLHDVARADLPARIADLLGACEMLRHWERWIDTSEPELRYRFALDGLRLSKSGFRGVLAAVRDRLRGHGLEDAPSSYAVQVVVDAGPAATTAWLVPGFERDDRFAWREADVGASIHPVVAAGLARLVRRGGRGRVLDPTCGSATLLVERARLDPDVALLGIDASPSAIRAARRNVEAAGLAERIRLRRGDATDPSQWPGAAEVLANLPFGVRSRRRDRDLEGLYRGVVDGVARCLEPAGRALLYTGNRAALEAALGHRAGRLRIVEERRIESGGLAVGATILEPEGAAPID